MSFPWSTAQAAAIARLTSGYNSADYNVDSNPKGFGLGGHIRNLVPALQDVASAGQATADAASAASTSALAAGTSATASDTARAASVTAKTAAEAAKTAAETAAGLAAISGRIYASTAAGIAATTNGQYFGVPQAAPNEVLLDLYVNSSGVAVYVNTAPSKAALDNLASTLSTTTPVGYSFVLPDDRGGVAFGLKTDGTAELTAVEATSLNGIPVFSVVDDADWMPAFPADLTMLISYGQSLSRGGFSTPPISAYSRFNNVQLGPDLTYVWSIEPSTFYPMKETFQETPMSGMADMVMERVEAEHGLAYTDYTHQILGAVPGVNGVAISELIKGTSNYTEMLHNVTSGKTIGNAAGKTLRVGSMCWTHGSSNYGIATAKATYKSALSQLVSDVRTDIAAITGQSTDLPFLIAQSCDHYYSGGSSTTPYIAILQTELSTELDGVYVVGAMYQLPKISSDHVHLTPAGSKWLGAYYGLAVKRILLDGDEWAPLNCIESFAQGNILFLRFNVPSGRLAFDTTTVASQANQGFSLVNSGGSSYTINSVTITGPDTVRIVTSATITSGSKVRYGFGADGGNLRDTQGDRIVFDPAGLNLRMDNWCLIFERVI
jgi:hypothetical protein